MKRRLFGEKQNQVKIDKGGNAASCVLIPISAFDSVVNNDAVPFVFRMSRLLVYMYGSTTCGQISALNSTRAVRKTAAEVMIGVLKSQHMVQKRKREGPTTHELFL